MEYERGFWHLEVQLNFEGEGKTLNSEAAFCLWINLLFGFIWQNGQVCDSANL